MQRACLCMAASCSAWRLTASTSSVTVTTSDSVRHVSEANCASLISCRHNMPSHSSSVGSSQIARQFINDLPRIEWE